MARREIQVFNMSFLDMMTNFLGAVIILFLLAAQNVAKAPGVFKKLEASYDENRLMVHGQIAGVQVNDTLMLIVKDNKELFKPSDIAASGSGRRDRFEKQYVDTSGLWKTKLPVSQQPEAIIVESVSTSPCNNAGTPDKPEDDGYSVSLKAQKLGKASATCLIDGKTYAYNSNITLGSFRIADGKRKIVIKDAQDATLSKTLEINPPPPCNSGSAPPPPPAPAAPKVPGKINFYVSWDDPADKVNIYVKKGRKWVYGGRSSDPGIGEFSELRGETGPFRRQNTNVETVRQMAKFIPGTYEVYAQLRENRKGANKEVPISLWLINEQFPYESKEFTFKLSATSDNPKNGGGKLLKTVTITEEGKFIIR